MKSELRKNKTEYQKEDIVSWENISFEDRNYDELKLIMDSGYKPCSSWFEGMVKKLKYDKRKVSQELECVEYDTIVTLRDKITKNIIQVKIGDLYENLLQITTLELLFTKMMIIHVIYYTKKMDLMLW